MRHMNCKHKLLHINPPYRICKTLSNMKVPHHRHCVSSGAPVVHAAATPPTCQRARADAARSFAPARRAQSRPSSPVRCDRAPCSLRDPSNSRNYGQLAAPIRRTHHPNNANPITAAPRPPRDVAANAAGLLNATRAEPPKQKSAVGSTPTAF